MRVRAGVDGDVVVVDDVLDEPLVGGGTVRILRRAAKPAVRDIHDRIGHGDRDALAVGLFARDVLVRPPDAGAKPFVGRREERAIEAVHAPSIAAVPWRADRYAR